MTKFKKSNNNNILVVDVETGGLDPEKNGICSVTLKKYDDEPELTIFFKPNRKLKYEDKALEINNISMEELEDKGVNEKTAVVTIQCFITENFDEKPIPLGQNTKFDLDFLKELFKRNDEDLKEIIDYKKLDTIVVAGALIMAGKIDCESVRLGDLHEKLFGEPIREQHTSRADVIATERIFKRMIELIKEVE